MSLPRRIGMLTAALALAGAAFAQEPVLEIDVGANHRQVTRAELLANPAVRTIAVTDDVSYHRPMRYRALPWSALLHTADPVTGDVQFTADDGFVANIPAAQLNGAGQAWLAIEPAKAPWPALKAGGPSAGPFYLVWLTPAKAAISPEQWPYQIAKIASAAPLELRYPQLLPKTGDDAAQRGLHVYTANCASCHQLNGAGDATIGPDLNRPHSPTEYFQEDYLRKLVRDPASVRNWGQRVMPGFSTAVLSDAELNDLLAYLRQMAKQRP